MNLFPRNLNDIFDVQEDDEEIEYFKHTETIKEPKIQKTYIDLFSDEEEEEEEKMEVSKPESPQAKNMDLTEKIKNIKKKFKKKK